VKIDCVTAVTDDAHRVHPIFHESDAQAANHRMKLELARLHLSNGFRFQNGDSVNGAILKKREHEARHIGGSG
jgi:hypothetical protein